MNTRGFGGLLGFAAGLLLSLTSIAHAAPFAYVSEFGTNKVSVVDVATNAVVATLPVGARPFGVAVQPDGSRVYVANTGGDTVSVIDVATNTVAATITVLGSPTGLVVHPNGSRVYVTSYLSDSLAIINTSNNSVRTVWLGSGQGPLGVAVSQDATRLYVTYNKSHRLAVMDVASLETTAPVVATSQVGMAPVGVAVHGARVYVANAGSPFMSVLDGTGRNLTDIPMATGQTGLAVHPTGSHVYVARMSGMVSVVPTSTMATASLTRVTDLAVGSSGAGLYGVGVSPSGGHVYVASQNDDRLYVIDTATLGITSIPFLNGARTALGLTAFGVFITPDQGSCDVSEWEKALEESEAALKACQGRNEELRLKNAELLKENEDLAKQVAGLSAELQWFRDQLANIMKVIKSLVARLFGERADANVAAAARDMAYAELQAAAAAAPKDKRLHRAQDAYDDGLAAMRSHRFGRAVREFRQAHEIAERIMADAASAKVSRVRTKK